MSKITRKTAMRAYHQFYRRVKGRGCVYCGLRATTNDHFVPISVVNMLQECMDQVPGKFLLPSCGECNGIASDRVFPTVAAKRRFIHARLKQKYRRVLALPEWSQAEREELGWTLRTSVDAGLAQKSVLTQRLAWRNTSNSSFVDIAKIRSGLLGAGQSSVALGAE